MTITITCDRQGDLCRAAVWCERKLVDLYVDRLAEPDPTGSIVIGRLVRLMPVTKGTSSSLTQTRSGWFDCGLSEKVYVDVLVGAKEGELYCLKIKSSQMHGKAFSGSVLFQDDAGRCEETNCHAHEIGVIKKPPFPWQRAIEDLADKKPYHIIFGNNEDYDVAKNVVAHKGDSLENLKYSRREAVHPQLDEICDELIESRIPLQGGGDIVIEKTEAFWTVDVNAGESSHFLNVNLAAVRAIARRARLCNMGGIILVDALRMGARPDISKMLNVLKRSCEDDPARVNVFGLSKLGIIEMTRTRRGYSLYDVMKDHK